MSDTSATPEALGRYEILTKFATGGMAELFLARERGIGGMERIVVIKRLLPHLTDQSSSVDMFLREARLVSRLNHPNVVEVYDLGEDDDGYFLVMEYLHGSTLRELATLVDERDRHFPLDIAVTIFEQTCRGLHAAHELRNFDDELVGLIHRDVSPQNLMCTTEGFVKLLDFGIAKAAEGDEATYSGDIKGKFAYMSPEQLHRDKLDRRSDIFSLGTVMWEICAGQRLFKRGGELETMTAITQEEVSSPRTHNSSIPADLEEVILHALEKDRTERYQTVESLREDLVAAAEKHKLMADQAELSDFVSEVAKDHLRERKQTLQNAIERSLTDDERAKLRHVSGTGSRARRSDSDSGAETVLDRPDSSSHPGSDTHDSDATAPLITDDRGALQVSPDAERPPDEDHPDYAGPEENTRVELRADDRVDGDTAPPTDTDNEGGLELDRSTLDDDAQRDRREDPTETQADVAPTASTGMWVGFIAIVLAMAAGAAGLAFWQSPAPAPSGEPIRVAWTPLAKADVLEEEISVIETYLEAETDRPVEPVLPDSYKATSELLRSGKATFAMLTPLLYVRTERVHPGITPLVTRESDGSVSSDGLILVRSDSDITRLEDLRGKKFCFTDRNSTTGHFLPRAFIRRRVENPESFIGGIHWSGTHTQVLQDLLDEQCDAAATYSGNVQSADNNGVPVGRLRNLLVTGYVPQTTFTAGPAAPDATVEAFKTALLNFKADVHAPGKNLRLTGFREVALADFEDIRRAIKENPEFLPEFEQVNSPAGEPPAPPADTRDTGSESPADTSLDAAHRD